MKKLHLLWLLIFVSCHEPTKEIQYTPLTSTVIEIEVLATLNDTTFIEARANTNIPKDGTESKIAKIIDPGTYYLNLDVDRPLPSQVKINNETFNVFIEPSDTTKITINEDGSIIRFTGELALVNNYYLEKKERLGYYDIRFPFNSNLSSKSTYHALKRSTDSIINTEITFFENYQKSNPLPTWFADYEMAEIIYSGASYKNSLPSYNRTFKAFPDSLPTDYFNYLDQIQINNPSAIFSSKYLWFLDNYFMRALPAEYEKLSGFPRRRQVRSYILAQSKRELSGSVKEVYHKYSFSSILPYFTDSLAIDSLAREFEITEYKSLVKISGTRSQGDLKPLSLNPGDMLPEFYVTDERDSTVSIRDFGDKILYVNFWATWCGPCISNIPALNEMIDEFKQDDKIVFLNICLDSDKERWLLTTSRYQLQGINLIAEGNWNSKLRSFFDIKGIPHYAILDENNILIENSANKAPKVKAELAAIRHKND